MSKPIGERWPAYTVVAGFTTETSGNPPGVWVDDVVAPSPVEAMAVAKARLVEAMGGDPDAIEIGHTAVVGVDGKVVETIWAEGSGEWVVIAAKDGEKESGS